MKTPLKPPVLLAVVAVAAISSPAPGVAARPETPAPIVRQAFRLSPTDGCFRYTGDAVEFVGRLRAGSYISVVMQTQGDDRQPVPADEEQRVPNMDAPEYKTPDKAFWFGPLPQSRRYTIGFGPTAAFGYTGRVTICGRTAAPGSPS